MNQQVIKYLEENKDKFSQESLAAALRQAGYKAEDIYAGMVAVFNVSPVATSQAKKEIRLLTRSKALDFCIGFFGPIVINIIFYQIFDFFVYLFSFGVPIIFLVFAYKYKYRLLFYGTLATIIIPIILFAFLTVLFLFSGGIF